MIGITKWDESYDDHLNKLLEDSYQRGKVDGSNAMAIKVCQMLFMLENNGKYMHSSPEIKQLICEVVNEIQED